MKIEKAIEILTDLLGESPQYPPDDRRAAVKLAIEALRRIQGLRQYGLVAAGSKLWGETED